jgi:hypothetical protein
MSERNKILTDANVFKLEHTFYEGQYGTIKILVTELDSRTPGPRVRFLSTPKVGQQRKTATLREAMGHLQVPYIDGSLPLVDRD